MIFRQPCTLQDMARKATRELRTEFSQVSGVGQAKLEDLGGPFLERINAYALERGWPAPIEAGGRSTPAAKAPRVVNQSYRETGRIHLRAEHRWRKAAAERGLAVGTVLGHLERLVEEGVEPWNGRTCCHPAEDRCRNRGGVGDTWGTTRCARCGRSSQGRFSATMRSGWRGWRGGQPGQGAGGTAFGCS